MIRDDDFEQQLARAMLDMEEQNPISTENYSNQGEAGGSFVVPNAQEQISISTEDHSNQGEAGGSYEMPKTSEQLFKSQIVVFWDS